LVQETFVEAQHDFGRFRGSTEAELLAWLRQVLVNRLHNLVRQYKDTAKRDIGREVALGSDDSSAEGAPRLADDEPSPSSEAIACERSMALEQALQRLPQEYRQVIAWRHDERRPFDEIGKLMGKTANAARKLWVRAIERLEQELERPP
jgi:RNA polymerase sigma-70 factor (ECF subfamily)